MANVYVVFCREYSSSWKLIETEFCIVHCKNCLCADIDDDDDGWQTRNGETTNVDSATLSRQRTKNQLMRGLRGESNRERERPYFVYILVAYNTYFLVASTIYLNSWFSIRCTEFGTNIQIMCFCNKNGLQFS